MLSTSTFSPPPAAPAQSTSAQPRLNAQQDSMMRDAARIMHNGGTQRDVAVYWKKTYNRDIGGIPDSVQATGAGQQMLDVNQSAQNITNTLSATGAYPEFNVSLQAAQGLTAGFADDAIGSILGLASGKGAQYGRDVYRAVLDQGKKDAPVTSAVANLAGAAGLGAGLTGATGLAAKGAAMGDVGRLGLMSAEGGGLGALFGAGETNGGISDRVKGAVIGGVAGLALSPLVAAGGQAVGSTLKTAARVGAAGVGKMLDAPAATAWSTKLQNMLPGGASASAKGRELMAQAVVMDQGSIDNAVKWANDQTAKGLPIVVGDAGENTRALIQASSGFRHPEKQAMVDDIFARQGDQGMRTIRQLFNVARLGYENAYEAADTHMATARQQSSPLYDAAHGKEITPTPRLLELFQKEPIFRDAWEAGKITAASEDMANLARGLPVPPLETAPPPKASGLLTASGSAVPASGPAQGTIINKTLPIRGLDYMKQELDNIIQGRYNTDTAMSGRRATALRAQLNSVLDDPALQAQAPEWTLARSIFRGEKEFVEAMQMGKGGAALNADANAAGKRFVNRPTAVVKRELGTLTTPGERTAYVIGALQDVADDVAAKRGATTDYANTVFGARSAGKELPNVLQNIKAVMPDANTAQIAEDYLRGEAGISLLAKTQVGSRTTPMRQGMTDIEDAANGGMLRGGAGVTVLGTGKRVADKIRLGTTGAVSDEISNLALKGLNGPNELVAALENLRPHAPTHSPTIAATFGSQLGRGAGALSSRAQPQTP